MVVVVDCSCLLLVAVVVVLAVVVAVVINIDVNLLLIGCHCYVLLGVVNLLWLDYMRTMSATRFSWILLKSVHVGEILHGRQQRQQ